MIKKLFAITLAFVFVVVLCSAALTIKVPKGTPVNGVAAYGVITISGLPTTGETFRVGNTTYTWKSSLSSNTASWVKIGGTASACGDNLAYAINRNATYAGTSYTTATLANSLVSASNNSGTVTLTARATGAGTSASGLGNYITLTESCTNVAKTSFAHGVTEKPKGSSGDVYYDASYIYVYTGSAWRRISHSSF